VAVGGQVVALEQYGLSEATIRLSIPKKLPMPDRSSDQVIQHARKVRRKQIEHCSDRAAREILAQLSKGLKPSVDSIKKLTASEFDDLST
jgi:hypothetical protein